MAITISNMQTLYFSGHPIKATISTDDANVNRFRLQVFDAANNQVGLDLNTPFFGNSLPLDFGLLIDTHLRETEGERLPTGNTLATYASTQFYIRATELTDGVAGASADSSQFTAIRGLLPENTFDEAVDASTLFSVSNAFLSNYPTPETIQRDETKYIAALQHYNAVSESNLILKVRYDTEEDDYTISLPSRYDIIHITIDVATFNIPSSTDDFSIQLYIGATPISEKRDYKIKEQACDGNYDLLYYNRYLQPQAFRLTDGWTIFMSNESFSFRDFKNYKRRRTKEAYKSYQGRRPFLRKNEMEALSELKNSDETFLLEDGAYRRINIDEKKWTETTQYQHLNTIELNFTKSQPHK